MSHGTTRELHLARAFHKVRGASAALPTGRDGREGPRPRPARDSPGPALGAALGAGRSRGSAPRGSRRGIAARSCPQSPRWGGSSGGSPSPRMPARREKPGATPTTLAAPSPSTRVPRRRDRRNPNCSKDAGDRQRSRRQRRAPLLPRPRPREAPATPHLSPPTRSLAAAVPTSPGRAAEPLPPPAAAGPCSAPSGQRRALGAAPRPPLPAAERPLPRPCASAGAGAGRGAVAAREEG